MLRRSGWLLVGVVLVGVVWFGAGDGVGVVGIVVCRVRTVGIRVDCGAGTLGTRGVIGGDGGTLGACGVSVAVCGVGTLGGCLLLSVVGIWGLSFVMHVGF